MIILYIIAVYYPHGDLIAQCILPNCNSMYPIAEELRFTYVTKRSITFPEIDIINPNFNTLRSQINCVSYASITYLAQYQLEQTWHTENQ